ncbi:N-6 DNA methylase [Streptococcus cristatus]|uniref:N-6 DNA methylase n=1 Tax=Streptococcus cristatus TaxID=45634 RepID=A0A5B0DBJ8_STRCR|nr:N-6 DNA methylase [Streptococcus cristatus]KAA0963948.1 N-6 DNA methylase [Streptococcus cristatus]
MSEQLIQNSIYSIPVIFDKYECYSIGATTVNNLMKSNIIKNVKLERSLGNKKPDVLILDDNKNVIIYVEQKIPSKFKSAEDIEGAIKQEIDVAKALGALIYIVSDGDSFIWVNPKTGEKILDENGNEINLAIKPKENGKQIVKFINDISLSISETNNQLLKKEFLDPTDLAQKINRILKNLTFASAKMSLYTFVELFLFKYLSDIGVLNGENSFEYIVSLYEMEGYSTAYVLGKYLEGARETMVKLFPKGMDGTSIINGKVFHIERDEQNEFVSVDNTDTVFKSVILEFEKYDKKYGKFLNISKDFKSKLFETFMKNSDDKSDMGQFFTPLKIVDEMVSMVDISEGMTICDPACGVGKFLLEAVEKRIEDSYSYSKGKLTSKIRFFGYDKMMSEKDDITIILAKANTLIYFSELFQQNNSFKDVQTIAKTLLNDSFYLHKSMLGTLENLEENRYDLILANPPYYQSKEMSEMAKATDIYKYGGSGVEALFLEWIMRSVKHGGVANIVLPDGIFSNHANKKLKEKLKELFFIDALISLPVNAFFNTPKKTYILTIRKKTENEIENNIVQDYPVFTYIAGSIGETLDVYRFDSEENDLKQAVVKYNFYRQSQDRNDLQEPFKSYLLGDSRLKLLPIEELDSKKSWIIENWWSEEEKIAIGLKKERQVVSIDEFQAMIDDMISLMQDFKEELEWLK